MGPHSLGTLFCPFDGTCSLERFCRVVFEPLVLGPHFDLSMGLVRVSDFVSVVFGSSFGNLITNASFGRSSGNLILTCRL